MNSFANSWEAGTRTGSVTSDYIVAFHYQKRNRLQV